jgi:hypothetical protein
MAICSEIYRIVYVIVGRNVQRLESEDIQTNKLSTSAQQLSIMKKHYRVSPWKVLENLFMQCSEDIYWIFAWRL